MKKFETFLEKINFKKVSIIYVIVSLVIILISIGSMVYVSRDKISLAIDYEKLSKNFKHSGFNDALKTNIDKLTKDSKNIMNVLVVDKDNNIVYKVNSNVVGNNDKFKLTPDKDNKKYLNDGINENTLYKVVREDNILINKDYIKNHEKILSDIDEDFYFREDIDNVNITLLNSEVNKDTKMKIYTIRNTENIPYARSILKVIAVLIGTIFIFYWLAMALWVYRDANRKNNNPALWGILVLITNLVGFIIYMIYKQNSNVCGSCGAIESRNNTYCTKCGNKIDVTCKKCNSKVSKYDKYCGKCGEEQE